MSLFRFLENRLIFTAKRTFGSTGILWQNEENLKKSLVVDLKDRSKLIDVETSIRYLKSEAYKKTYEGNLIWKLYRRNFKGPFPPTTRYTCIRKNRISTGSPCPICRDEYLVVDYKNVDLLKQFISPFSGEILSTRQTGVCQKQHEKILIAIQKAYDYGLISFEVPHRSYDYELYLREYLNRKCIQKI